MPDELISIAAAAGLGSNTVLTVHDLAFNKVYREKTVFADAPFIYKAPKRPDLKGGETIRLYKDTWDTAAIIDQTLTPLDEESDVDAVRPPAATYVDVTVDEYGHVKKWTQKMATLNSLEDIAGKVATNNADNAVQHFDRRVQAVLDTATQIYRSGGAANDAALDTGSTYKLAYTDLDKAFTKLRSGAVPRFTAAGGPVYMAYTHPDVTHDLRADTAAGGWRYPLENGGMSIGGNIAFNVLGVYHGFAIVENLWTKSTLTGAGSDPVYRTFCTGPEVVAHVPVLPLATVLNPGFDSLNRFFTAGWKRLDGLGLYRQESIVKIHSASSFPASHGA